MKTYKTLLAVLLLAGCTSASGVKITEDQLLQLKKDKATIQVVTARFGQPSSSQLMPTGERLLTYSYSTVKTDAKSYIPIVGPLMGGSGFSASSATLTFTPDGTLSTYQTNSNNFGSGTSLSVGTEQ